MHFPPSTKFMYMFQECHDETKLPNEVNILPSGKPATEASKMAAMLHNRPTARDLCSS